MINVTKEGRDDIYLVDQKEIIDYIKKYPEKYIHNFVPSGMCLIGADWRKKDVIEKIKESERIAILTGGALRNNKRHALSVIANNELFMFDIGEITEKDLNIQ